MIYNSPNTWQDLQDKVCIILNQVGFKAETNVTIKTPRGTTAVDVYATDPFSIEQIRYVIECKNWETSVPQTIVHAFTAVMQETGANMGFIISKTGFQKGAYDYASSTNINVYTFSQFQLKYVSKWFASYFCPTIGMMSDSLREYTEEINSLRDKFVSRFNEQQQQQFEILRQKHYRFAYVLLLLWTQYSEKGIFTFVKHRDPNEIYDIQELKSALATCTGRPFISNCFSDLLVEIVESIKAITEEFNSFFGMNIFRR